MVLLLLLHIVIYLLFLSFFLSFSFCWWLISGFNSRLLNLLRAKSFVVPCTANSLAPVLYYVSITPYCLYDESSPLFYVSQNICVKANPLIDFFEVFSCHFSKQHCIC